MDSQGAVKDIKKVAESLGLTAKQLEVLKKRQDAIEKLGFSVTLKTLKQIEKTKLPTRSLSKLMKMYESGNKIIPRTVQEFEHLNTILEVANASLKENGEKAKQVSEQYGNLDATVNASSQSLAGVESQFKSTDKVINNMDNSVVNASANLSVMNNNLESISDTTEKAKTPFQRLAERFEIASDRALKFSQLIDATIQTIDRLTDPDFIKRVQQALKLLAIFFRIKGFEELSRKVRRSSSNIEEFAAKMRDFSQGAGESLLVFGERAELALDAMDTLTTSAKFSWIPAAALVSQSFKENSDELLKLTKRLGQSSIKFADIAADISNISVLNFVDKLSLMSIGTKEVTRDLKNLTTVATKDFKSMEAVFGLASRTTDRFFGDIRKGVKDVAVFGKVMKKLAHPSIISMVEAGTILGPVLATIGLQLSNLENKTAKVTGAVLLAASALMLGFAGAVVFLINEISTLAALIGDKLLAFMGALEKKAQKADGALRQLTFVLKGLARTFSTEAVGSIEQWNKVIEDTKNNTTFAMADISKAIKLVTLDGKALGLTFEQMSGLIARATDVAAANGRELTDITGVLLKALAGSSQGALMLGIDVTNAGLAHSKLLHSAHKTVEQLNEEEKILARLGVIFEKTAPVIGFARSEMDSITGSSQVLQRTLDELGVEIGRQGKFTVLYQKTLNKLATSFLAMPKAILSTIGAMIDFTAVTLKVIGEIGKLVFTILTPIAIINGLAFAINKLVIVQKTLTTVFAALTFVTGVQTAAVTSASVAWTNFIAVLNVGVVSLFTNIGKAIGLLTAKLISMTLAVISSPLFLQGVIIAGSIALIVKAIKDIDKQTGIFTESLTIMTNAFNDGTDAGSSFGDVMGSVAKVLSQSFVVAANIVVAAISGVVIGVSKAIKGLTMLAGILPGVSKSMKKDLENIGEVMDENIKKFSGSLAVAAGKIFDLGSNTAQAAEANQGLIKSFKNLTKELFNSADASEKVIDTLEKDIIKARVAGETGLALLLESKLIKERKLITKDSEEKKQLAQQLVQNQAEISQFFVDSINEASKAIKSARIESLEDNGTVAALEKAVKLKQELETADLIKRKVQLEVFADTPQAKKAISSLEKQIKAVNTRVAEDFAEKIKAAEFKSGLSEETLKGFDKITEQTKQMNAMIDSSTLTQEEIIDKRLQGQLKEIDLIRKKIQLEGNAASEINKQRLDALKAAEDIAKKAATTEKKKAQPKGAVLFDQSQLNMIQNSLGEGASNFAGAVSGLSSGFMSGIGAANAIVDGLQGIVDAIPNLLDKVANLFDSITNLPTKIAEGVENVIASAINLVSSFIPNLIAAIPRILESLIQGILIDLPNAFLAMMETLPEMLIGGLIDKLPSLIEKLIVGLVTAMPKVAVAMIRFMVTGIPKIIVGLIAAIPELVGALIDGLIEAFMQLGDLIVGLFTGNFEDVIPEEKLTQAAERAGEAISGATDQLFSVIEAKQAGQSIDTADRIRDAIGSSTQAAGTFLSNLWDTFLAALQVVWAAIKLSWDVMMELVKSTFQLIGAGILLVFETVAIMFDTTWAVIKGIFEVIIIAFKAVWEFGVSLFDGVIKIFKSIWEFGKKVFGAVIDLFKGVWDTVLKLFRGEINIFEAVWDIAKKIFQFGAKILGAVWDLLKDIFNVGKDIFNSLLSGLGKIFSGIGEKILKPIGEGIAKIGKSIGEFFKSAAQALIGPIKKFFNGVGDIIVGPIKKFFNNLGDIIIEPISDFFDDLSFFSKGGLVPDYLAGGGFPRKGTDTVPAMLTPGEFVLPSRAVKSLGSGNLEALRQGRGPSQGAAPVINISMNVETKQAMDENFIRNRLMPRVKEEFKRASLDGQFIISERGIR